MIKVMCPNCRNEQEIETDFDRCIVCGEILSDKNKLKARVIEKMSRCSEKDVRLKFSCELCGKYPEEDETLSLLNETHLVCGGCKWKAMKKQK